jgi:uncharacterized protein (TIGR02444 family)
MLGKSNDANPLWHFSLSVYEGPGVADYCIEMQDRYDILVNLMLFVCWLGTRQIKIDCQEIKQAETVIFDYNARVTKPIRIERRQLDSNDDKTGALKKQLLERELQAEFNEQNKLYQWFCRASCGEDSSEKLVETNLRCYFDIYSVPLTLPNPLLKAALCND